MPDFKKTQGELQNAKKNRNQSQNALFFSIEKLKKLEREKSNFLRKADDKNDAYILLLETEKLLKKEVVLAEKNLVTNTNRELSLIDTFKVFSDPRESVQHFSDDYPLLLLPIRLETRFKEVSTSGDSIQPQLWVRIFPDDCSVDTFENTLSEAEVIRARNFWLTTWSAGKSDEENVKPFIQAQQKAAWKILSGNIQSGRAYWITRNYFPVNIDKLPERESDKDVILTIPTEVLPDIETQTALEEYWKAIWIANSDAESTSAALTALISSTVVNDNKDLAEELITNYSPFNLNDTSPADILPTPKVKVTFIQFNGTETLDTRLSSWSQAAKATTLPERFVLLGYKGKDAKGSPIEVMNEIGRAIPDPLIIGPNPSLDTNTVLKNEFVEEYTSLANNELKTSKLRACYQDLKDTIKAEKTLEAFIDKFFLLDEQDIVPELEKIFDDLKDDIKAVKYIEYLSQKSDTKWLFDFEEAVNVGMGFKVNLTSQEFKAGFDRLFVLGVKLSADEKEAKTALEELIEHHHYGNNGFSIMPQGTSTNNTEDEKSAYSESEDPEETFSRYLVKPTEEDPDDFFERKDGKWLTTLLGIDADKSSINLVENYYQTDQCEARAMNTALWSGTFRYFMESMMTPVFNREDEKIAHSYFTRYVSGRGNIPSIRIGDQPYGILATNTISNQKWLFQENNQNILSKSQFAKSIPLLRKVSSLLEAIRGDFELFLDNIAFVGKEGDAHEILLEAIGLHASSVEFYQRYAKSFDHLYNLWLYLIPDLYNILSKEGYQSRGINLLKKLGHVHNEFTEDVPILEKFFLSDSNQLKGDLIDDQPLSEKKPIRPYTAVENENEKSENFIYWLIENALSNHSKIKKQEGFTDQAPTSLLYQMLRHALELEFSNTALDLHLSAKVMNHNQVAAAKIDRNFIGIQSQKETAEFESKYDYLDRKDNRIADQNLTIAQYISNHLKDNNSSADTNRLQGIIKALNQLKDVPTARLERVFVEHLDCCTYRLDAWLLGLVNLQLNQMRINKEDGENEEEVYKKGIYLGAYGWVENLKPDQEVLVQIALKGERQAIFDPAGENDINTDSSNAGYIHAPSINQAISAAVLRNAYISNASNKDPEVYKVNLSSERVRMALGIIEGMQQGQSLGVLLGYQLERGLHDRYEEAEADAFIYELREAFPLKSNLLDETSQDNNDKETASQIKVRNVIDGLSLINHINSAKIQSDKIYPFGKSLKQASSDQAKVINSEVDRILNINDALADLSTAEGIHQAVMGNYDRAAATLDTYSKGSFPQTPDIVKTPRSGVSLTNRVGIHLKIEGLIVPQDSNPRVKAEPAINQFLSEFLPPMTEILCHISYHVPTYEKEVINPMNKLSVSMDDLGFSPLDLFYLLDIGHSKSLSALDDYILKYIHESISPRPDIELKINYTKTSPNETSIFEIAPLITELRSLILAARPLKPSDISLPIETNSSVDSACSIDVSRIESAFNQFKDNFTEINNQVSDIDLVKDGFVGLIIDDDFEKTLVDNKTEIIKKIDAYTGLFLNRLHKLNQFGVQQTGFGFIFNSKAAIYAGFYKKVLQYEKRWKEKLSSFNELIEDYRSALSTEEKIGFLQKAERTISTVYTLPLPDPPDTVGKYEAILNTKKASFIAKLAELRGWLDGSFIKFDDLVDELNKIKTGVGSATGNGLNKFDLQGIETDNEERQIIVFAEDLKNKAVSLNASLIKTVKRIQDSLDLYKIEASQSKKLSLLTDVAELLFGESFKIIPSFLLNTDQASEFANSLNATDQLLSYQKNEEKSDFPVDDWLYSIARVRDKLGLWENTVVLSEGFNNITRDLTPVQLPFKNNDTWLGLSYPEDYEIDGDKLLYTAYLNGINPGQRLCGLLIDEWTEVIPAKMETSGLSFQYDQPNAEPPQSFLLVTPTEFTGHWEWTDISGTLHETLDMAKLRAIEPRHIDQTAYAQFLPATVSAVTTFPLITIALNYALNNGLTVQANTNEDG